MRLSDDAFLNAFENQTLPESEFDHRGHLRLAWLYLDRYPLEEAIRRTAEGISAFAASLGAEGKFHHTLTEAIVRIMHGRIDRTPDQNFNNFLINNPDLIENMQEILLSHYSEERLRLPEGKWIFLEPDIKAF